MNDFTTDDSNSWESSAEPAAAAEQPKKSTFPVLPLVLGALALGVVIGLATAASTTPPSRRKRYERSVRSAGKAVRKAIEPRRKEFFDQVARVRSSAESALNQLPSLPDARKNHAIDQAIAKLQALAPWN